MEHPDQNFQEDGSIRQIPTAVKTTLYDLVEAVSEVVNPENNRLVSEIVLDILNTGRSNVRVL